MVLPFKLFLFLCCAILALQSQNGELSSPKKNYIKVLLSEMADSEKSPITISSNHGLMVNSKENNKLVSYYFKKPISITHNNGFWFINGKKIPSQKILRIQPTDGHIHYNHADYFGTFCLYAESSTVFLINNVELEDYIYSVLCSESWPGWPLEVNKVFAITCRSYAIKKIFDSKTNNKPYHIKNSNAHQTYRGIKHNDIHRQAVHETAGLFLGYKGEPIAAMYDSCCGGIIPAHINEKAYGIDFKKAPYLARKHACTFCKNCKIFNWGFELPLKEFEKRLSTTVPQLNTLHNITIAKLDRANLVHQLELHDSRTKHIIGSQKLYSLFKEVKSWFFTITKKKYSVLIKGKGFGHHLGLCQWGTYNMVKAGWKYPGILHFFYPQTQILQLK